MCRKIFRMCALAIAAVVMVGCASVRTTETWVDKDYTGGSKKMLVLIGLSTNETHRRIYEDKQALALTKAGVASIKSYKVVPDIKKLNKDSLLAGLKGQTFDGLLMVKVVNVEDVQRYVPGTTYNHVAAWDGYHRGYAFVHDPGYITYDREVFLETTLYDAKSQQIIWKLHSEAVNPSGVAKEVDKLSDITVKGLLKAELIAK